MMVRDGVGGSYSSEIGDEVEDEMASWVPRAGRRKAGMR